MIGPKGEISPLAQFKLTKKTALITGAAGMLGIEHACALLEAGARVLLTDISENLLDKAKCFLSDKYDSGMIMTFVMDVSSEASISSVADQINDLGLDVNILINNAAIDPKVSADLGIIESSRLENFSLDEWNKQLSVGLTGAFLCSKKFGTSMATKKHGVILNIASDLSVIAPDQRLYRKEGVAESLQPVKPVTYSVLKSGLIGLTRYLSTYWADMGVRVNALSPGGVLNGQDNKFIDRLEHLIPMGRMARSNEYRGAVQFLCSDASSYLTGQNIVIDGGRSVW